MVTELGAKNSVFNSFIAEIRDKGVQQDSMRFRRNLERIGEVIAYELSQELTYQQQEVESPLGIASMNLCTDKLVLATILRAGLPMHQGMLNYFDQAECAFVSAYRKHEKGADTFDINIEYLSSPDIDDKVLILCDPMLASGKSMALVLKEMQRMGTPKAIHVVAAIASVDGIKFVKRHVPSEARIWVGAIDNEMTARSYIVPGLGDAGDLAYGKKV